MADNPDKNSNLPGETSDKVTLPTSFKRSFDQLALDYNDGDNRTRRHTESSSSSSESQNSERAKRARSEGDSDATGSSSSVTPSITQVEDIDMVDTPGNESLPASASSPTINSPADTDDLTLALAHIPTSARATQTSTGESIGSPHPSGSQDVMRGVTGSATSEDAFRISMERYTAFDSHISALRNGTDAEGSETPPPSRRSVSVSTREQSIADSERRNDINVSSVAHWPSRSPSLSRMSATEAALHHVFLPSVLDHATPFPPLPNPTQDFSDNSDVETDTVPILANIGSSVLSRDRRENSGAPRESIGNHDIDRDLDVSVDALMELASNGGRDDTIEPLQTVTSTPSALGPSHRPSWGHPPSTLHDRVRRADEIIRSQLSAIADDRGIGQSPRSQLSQDPSSVYGEPDRSANLAHRARRPPSHMLYPHRSAFSNTSVGSGHPTNEHYTTSGDSGPAESSEASLYGNSSVQMLVEAARNELTQASRRQHNRLNRAQDQVDEEQTRQEAYNRPMSHTPLYNLNPSPSPLNSIYHHAPPRYISRRHSNQLIPLPHPPSSRYHFSSRPAYSHGLSEDTRPYVPAFTSPGLEAGSSRPHSPPNSRTAATHLGAAQYSDNATQLLTARQMLSVGTAPDLANRAVSVSTLASPPPVQSSLLTARAEWDAAAQDLVHQLEALTPRLEMLLDSLLTPTIVRERIQRLADEDGCLRAILPAIIERGRRSRATVAASAAQIGPGQGTGAANTANSSSGGSNVSSDTAAVQSTASSPASSQTTASNAPPSTESIASTSNPTERLRALLSPPRGRARDASSADRNTHGFNSTDWEQQVMELSAYTLGLSADLRSHATGSSAFGSWETHAATPSANTSVSNVSAHRVSPFSAPGVSPPRTARPVAIPVSVSTRNVQSDETRPSSSASTVLTRGQRDTITTPLDHADNLSSVASFTGDTRPIGGQSIQLAQSSSSAQVRDFRRRLAVPGTTVGGIHAVASASASNPSRSRAGQSFPASRSAESLQSHAQASGTFVTHPARNTQRSALQEEIDRLRSRLQVEPDSLYDFSPRTPIWDDSVSLWSPHHPGRQRRVNPSDTSAGAPSSRHEEASLISPPQLRPPRVRRRARPDSPVEVDDSEEEVEVLFAAGALGNSQDTSIMEQDSQDIMEIDDPGEHAPSTNLLSSPERTHPQPEQNAINLATDHIAGTTDRTNLTEGVGIRNPVTTPSMARPRNSIGSTSPTRGINLAAYHDGPFRDTLARTRAYSRMRSRLDSDYRRAMSAGSPVSRTSTNTNTSPRSEALGGRHDPARRAALPTAAFELEHRTAELQQSISNMARAVDYLQRIANPLRGGSTSRTGEGSRRPTDPSPAHMPQSREKAPSQASTTRTEVLNPNRARREAMEQYREDNILRELALETELAWMGGGNTRRDGRNPYRPLPVALPRGDRAPGDNVLRGAAERRNARRTTHLFPHDNEWLGYSLPGDLAAYDGLQALSSMIGGGRSRGTPDSVVNSLPSGTYGEWAIPGETEERCPICFDDYQASDPVLKLPNCAHWLHRPCLQQWLKSARTCPVCRARVESGQVGQASSSTSARPFATSREHPWVGPPPMLHGRSLVEMRTPHRYPLTGRETVIPSTLARTSSTTRAPASSVSHPSTTSLASPSSGSFSSSTTTPTTIATSPTGPGLLGPSPARNPLNSIAAATNTMPAATRRTPDHPQDELEGWQFFGGLEDADNPWDN